MANTIFSARLKALMKEEKTTQEELARFISNHTGISITRQAVGQWCNGKSSPIITTIPYIAEFFGISSDYLFGMTDVDSTDIGKRIKELRESQKLTQDELAKNLNTTRLTVAKWETGRQDLKTKNIFLISRFFGVSSDYLLGLSDVKSTDVDKKAVCEYTHLTDTAIDTLEYIFKYDKPAYATLNYFLEHYSEIHIEGKQF